MPRAWYAAKSSIHTQRVCAAPVTTGSETMGRLPRPARLSYRLAQPATAGHAFHMTVTFVHTNAPTVAQLRSSTTTHGRKGNASVYESMSRNYPSKHHEQRGMKHNSLTP